MHEKCKYDWCLDENEAQAEVENENEVQNPCYDMFTKVPPIYQATT